MKEKKIINEIVTKMTELPIKIKKTPSELRKEKEQNNIATYYYKVGWVKALNNVIHTLNEMEPDEYCHSETFCRIDKLIKDRLRHKIEEMK